MGLHISAQRKRNFSKEKQILDLIESDSLKDKVESLFDKEHEVFSMSITDNLITMAKEAGFYEQLWHLSNVRTCEDLLPYIEQGLAELESNPIKYEKFSAKNGRGTYTQFIEWLQDLIEKLKIEPKAELYTSL